jgi:integrase
VANTRTGFTDSYLRHLKPREKRYDVTDARRRGLQLRVFPSGEKSFQFRYTLHGQTRRVTFGPYPSVTLAEAHFKHAEAERLLDNGKDPADLAKDSKRAEREAGTVAELADEFMRRYVKPSRKRPEQMQQMLDANVLPHWRNKKAKDITARDVVLLLDKIVDRGSKVMANRVASAVSQMFKFGVLRGIVSGSPCVALTRPGGREKNRERKLTEIELNAFWEKLDTSDISPPIRAALRLLLVTGQRRGELARAKWGDIDLDEGRWIIPADNSKNGRAHEVPLTKLAIDLFEQLKKLAPVSNWVLPSPTKDDEPIIDRSISRAVRNNEKHFGIAHFTPHDLRRTAASIMSMLGVPRLHVSKVLNHTDDATTAIYDRHDYWKEKQTALDHLSTHLKSVFEGSIQKVVSLPLRKTG